MSDVVKLALLRLNFSLAAADKAKALDHPHSNSSSIEPLTGKTAVDGRGDGGQKSTTVNFEPVVEEQDDTQIPKSSAKGQLCYGMCSGFPAILTPQLQEEDAEFRITDDEESWIVSLDNVATPLVCLACGFMQQRLGPRALVVLSCLPYFCAWLCAALATSAHELYLSRLLVGVSHGFISTSVYTIEISSRNMRATYSLWEGVVRCLGCLTVYILGYFLRWRTIASLGPIVPLLALTFAIFCAPESPVFLLRKGKVDCAHRSLRKLHGPSYPIHEELNIIAEDLREQKHRRAKPGPLLFDLHNHPEIYKPFLIILTLGIIQQFSGMSILRAYVVKIFNEVFLAGPNSTALPQNGTTLAQQSSGQLKGEAYISAIVIGVVRLLSSLLLSHLLLRYRRRTMYFTSAVLSALSLVLLATSYLLVERLSDGPLVVALRWGCLTAACMLVFAVQLGVQTLPNLLSGELYTSDMRSICKGISRCFTSLLLVVCLKMFPSLEATLGLQGTFFLFSMVLLCSIPVIYVILPETKDLSLEVIQNYFLPAKTTFYVDWRSESDVENCTPPAAAAAAVNGPAAAAAGTTRSLV